MLLKIDKPQKAAIANIDIWQKKSFLGPKMAISGSPGKCNGCFKIANFCIIYSNYVQIRSFTVQISTLIDRLGIKLHSNPSFRAEQSGTNFVCDFQCLLVTESWDLLYSHNQWAAIILLLVCYTVSEQTDTNKRMENIFWLIQFSVKSMAPLLMQQFSSRKKPTLPTNQKSAGTLAFYHSKLKKQMIQFGI